jgi:hypothetical protein
MQLQNKPETLLHSENMIEPLHGKTDCRPLFESLLAA